MEEDLAQWFIGFTVCMYLLKNLINYPHTNIYILIKTAYLISFGCAVAYVF